MSKPNSAEANHIDRLVSRVHGGDAEPEEVAELREWRRQSADNEAEYEARIALLRLSARVPALAEVGPPPTTSDLEARWMSSGGAQGGSGWRSTVRWWATRAVAAAALVVLGLGLAELRRSPSPATGGFGVVEVSTGKGETTTFELDDGTVVKLAAESRFRVLRTGNRDVHLEGRGYFAVTEGDHPFRVRTAGGDVTVLGTRFDVSTRERDVQVVVLEGRVALSGRDGTTEVGVGQMGRVIGGEPTPVVNVGDLERLVSWTGQLLVFQSTPVPDAVRQIEREYGVEVRILGDGLTHRVVTAWFVDRPLREVLDVVCLAVAAECTIDRGVVRMVPANDAGRAPSRPADR